MTIVNLFVNMAETQKDPGEGITLLLAHGAGAPAHSPFMESLSEALVLQGITTIRFEFPYMERRRDDGRKRPPDRQPALLAHFREVIRQVAADYGGKIFIGGKSMGGRMASILAAETDLPEVVNGCVCFGYPFHPPGKSRQWRVDHFDQFCRPVMIIQGTRDPFGKRDEVEQCERLAASDCRIHWIEGGDHDLKPLAKQPETRDVMIQNAARAAAAFMGYQA